MGSRWRPGPRSGLVLATVLLAACGKSTAETPQPQRTVDPQPTFQLGVEHMPGPASIWLTSNPATPRIAVSVEMTSPTDSGIRYAHTFPPGTVLRGSFATSEGAYRMRALDGACGIDVRLGPSDAAEIELRLEGAGCTLTLRRTGSLDDPSMWH